MDTKVVHSSPGVTTAPVVLWVEDGLTGEYLLKLWQTHAKLFDVRVGGTCETIRAAVHDERTADNRRVFGVIDRDFRPSNHAQWANPDSGIEVFVPPVHEMENYLLDWDALAGCDENQKRHRRARADTEARAQQEAGRMVWWMACRSVLAKYRDMLVGDYPHHPKVTDIPDRAAAQAYIASSPWYSASFPNATTAIAPAGALAADLGSAQTVHVGELNSGRWVQTFSGKEIFRSIRGYLFNSGYASAEAMDTDLAKSVGEWQHANNCVPTDLVQLRDALKARVGL